MDRLDLLAPVLAVGVIVVRVHAHRAGAIQREHGHDVFEAGGLHAAQQIAHGAAVELEHAEGVAARQQLVGGRIVERQMIHIQIDAAVGLDVVERVTDDGEVAQAEEVHLQQADGLTRRIVPAGDDGAVLGPLPHRDGVGERFGGHDDRAGVHTGVADQAFQSARGLVDLGDVGVAVDEFTDLGGFLVALVVRVGDAGHRDVLGHDRRRQRLGDLVGDGEAGLAEQHPRGVLDRGLGLDGAEGDDLRDPIAAPFLGGVADHFTAAAIVEVDIDIGHRDALGVEESLEQQPVRDGVDIGDAHGVGHQRTGGRTTAGADPDADLERVVDQVADDEEVGREAHLADDAELVFGAADVFGRHPVGEAALEATHDLFVQPAGLRLTLGHREDRHPVTVLPHVVVGLHALTDEHGVVAGAGYLGVPDGAHLGGGFEVVAVTVEFEPGGVRQRLAGLNAQQRFVIGGLVFGDVVAVVGGKRRDAELLADVEQALAHPAFDGQAVVHHLQEEVLRPEDLLPLGGGFQRFALVAEAQPGLHLAGRAAGGGDDALGVLGDEFFVHARPLAELALDGGQRRQFEQVAQAGRVLGDHRHMGVGAGAGDVVALLARIAPLHALGVEPGAGRDIGLDADDRLDARLLGGVVELRGAVHVAVVGHPDRRHAQPVGLGEQRRDLGRAVQHRVLGVVVQVNERSGRVGQDGPSSQGLDGGWRIRF